MNPLKKRVLCLTKYLQMKKSILLVIMLVVFMLSGGGNLVENTISVDYDEETLQLLRFKKEEKGLYLQSDYDSVLVMLKEWEGFSSIPYEDLAGGQVVGYGHMIRKGEEHLRGSVITKEEAENILRSDYNYFIDFTYSVTGLEGKRLLALSALLFNTGEGKLVSSGLYKSINEGSVDLEQEWLRWCHYKKDGEVVRSTHLLQRRKWEVRFYITERKTHRSLAFGM